MRENEFVCCLVERGNKTFMWGPSIFHLGPHKICLSIMERTRWREFDGEMTKLTMCTPVAFFFSFFFFLMISWAALPPLFLFIFYFSYGFLGNVASSFYIFFFLLISWRDALCFFFFLMVSWATLPPLFLLLFFSLHFLGMVLCFCVFFFF